MVLAKKTGSILDSVAQEAARLAGMLGPGDRTNLNEDLDSVREIEQRIEPGQSLHQALRLGGFAERALIHENQLAVLPKEMAPPRRRCSAVPSSRASAPC